MACPSCGHKHSLDLLLGLDSFLCKECGRKLAVPPEAAKLNQEPANKLIDPGEVVVVARSSINIDSDQIVREVKPNVDSDQPQIVSRSNESVTPDPEDIQKPLLKPKKTFQSPSFWRRLQESNFGLEPLSPIWRLFAWALAIPTGFLIVVIIPRSFGGGFRASQFLDIITTQGLSRYRILVLLVVLWSSVSVLSLYIYRNLIQKFVRARSNTQSSVV